MGDATEVVVLTRDAAKALVVDAMASALEGFVPPRRSALLTVDELARELAVSASTVRRLRQRGCPVVMVCESVRFDLAECRAWLRGEGGNQPRAIVDAPDRREACAGCGQPYEPHVTHMVRMLGEGHSYHWACFEAAEEGTNG